MLKQTFSLPALVIAAILQLVPTPMNAAQKPPLTLDDFFNSVSFTALKISPDGSAVVIGTERADWSEEIFRKDLWLYRENARASSPVQLTQSGHDFEPQWSPDGHWIAFLSNRKVPGQKSEDDSEQHDSKTGPTQIYLISPSGGEAFAITSGDEEVHSFA